MEHLALYLGVWAVGVLLAAGLWWVAANGPAPFTTADVDAAVQRGIEQADGNRVLAHRLINALKVAALHRQQLVQRFAAGFLCFGDDHLAPGGDAVLFKEHVLGTAKADPLRTEFTGDLRIARIVGVSADFERADGIRPAHSP